MPILVGTVYCYEYKLFKNNKNPIESSVVTVLYHHHDGDPACYVRWNTAFRILPPSTRSKTSKNLVVVVPRIVIPYVVLSVWRRRRSPLYGGGCRMIVTDGLLVLPCRRVGLAFLPKWMMMDDRLLTTFWRYWNTRFELKPHTALFFFIAYIVRRNLSSMHPTFKPILRLPAMKPSPPYRHFFLWMVNITR